MFVKRGEQLLGAVASLPFDEVGDLGKVPQEACYLRFQAGKRKNGCPQDLDDARLCQRYQPNRLPCEDESTNQLQLPSIETMHLGLYLGNFTEVFA